MIVIVVVGLKGEVWVRGWVRSLSSVVVSSKSKGSSQRGVRVCVIVVVVVVVVVVVIVIVLTFKELPSHQCLQMIQSYGKPTQRYLRVGWRRVGQRVSRMWTKRCIKKIYK